jgi:mRNA interferase MazF
MRDAANEHVNSSANDVGSGRGWVITEQIRTVAAARFRRHAPEIALSEDALNEVRHVLAQMLIL